MAYELAWHEDKRIILMRIHDNIPLPEVVAVSRETAAMLDGGTAPVHVLVDFTGLRNFPADVHAIWRSAEHFRHPALGWHVLYGTTNPVVRFMASLISRLYGLRLAWATSTDDALAFLAARDATLARAGEDAGG